GAKLIYRARSEFFCGIEPHFRLKLENLDRGRVLMDEANIPPPRAESGAARHLKTLTGFGLLVAGFLAGHLWQGIDALNSIGATGLDRQRLAAELRADIHQNTENNLTVHVSHSRLLAEIG